MRTLKLFVIGVAAIGLLTAGQVATSATNSHPTYVGPTGPLVGHQVNSQVIQSNETLKKTVIVQGSGNITLAADAFTPIDPGETIVCPGTKSCTIEATISVQAIGIFNNPWAICLRVGGATAPCPYYGILLSNFPMVGTVTQSYPGFLPGSHTVQTIVYTNDGGTAFFYNMTYHSYNP